MKILLVGATGTIGSQVAEALAQRHEVIGASSKHPEWKVDISDAESIRSLYQKLGKVDAVVSAAGHAHFGPFAEASEADFYKGIRSKMMGQINLVMIGQKYVNDGGSFTLTTGILSDDPIRMGAGLSMVNGAVNAFGMAAAVELPRGLRINVVCSGMVEDAVDKYGPYFPGHDPIPMWRVVNGYVKSVEGVRTGEIIKIY